MGNGLDYEKELRLLEKISANFDAEGNVQGMRRVWVSANSKDLIDVCAFIKEEGFEHLSAISVTDWITEGEYELTYHLWSYREKILLTVKTKIDRDKPTISSTTPVWGESAQIHERELHELFGVKFEGNADLTPLFLEDWRGPPPFRKDFDWRKYVRGEYYDRENEREEGYWEVMPQELYKKRESIPKLTVRERTGNFREVSLGYSEKAAVREASRCLQCKEPTPCIEACPAHLDIKKYVRETSEGQYKAALNTILEGLPCIGTVGRVCPHPCEEACSRADLEEPISIRAIKRFVADQCTDEDWYPKVREPLEDKIAVIGTGPAGLTVARQLAFAGYRVHVFDSSTQLGGIRAQAIPDYRLPPEVPKKEIKEIRKLGVRFKKGNFGKDFTTDSLLEQGYRAVFLGIGLHKMRKMNIPGEKLKGVYSALSVLKAIKSGRKTHKFKDKDVIVVGGGNVAMDAARSTLRLGGRVTVVYRRDLRQMPATEEEIQEAREEGVNFNLLVNPTKILGKGRVGEVECVRMKLGPPDASGRPRPAPIEGSEFRMKADFFIEAVGQVQEPGLLESMGVDLTKRGLIEVDDNMMTSINAVFAAGDSVKGPSTIIEVVADALQVAESMIKYLEKNE